MAFGKLLFTKAHLDWQVRNSKRGSFRWCFIALSSAGWFVGVLPGWGVGEGNGEGIGDSARFHPRTATRNLRLLEGAAASSEIGRVFSFKPLRAITAQADGMAATQRVIPQTAGDGNGLWGAKGKPESSW
eukprot:2440883-Rhodomonas_salina.2